MPQQRIRNLQDRPEFVWRDHRSAAENYEELGALLSEADGDLYLLVADRQLVILGQNNVFRVIPTSTVLDAVVKDRVDAYCIDRNGRRKDIPKRDLGAMLASEVFLDCFLPVDIFTPTPLYLPDWQLTRPGYNDGGEGARVFYAGPAVEIADNLEAIEAFLGVMDFAEEADRTNAVALALTIRLRNLWPGAKPVGAITATKSHSGKDTVRDFAVGIVPTREISWEAADWAVEQHFEKATRSPDVGVVSVGNVRSGSRPMASSFLERFITDPAPMITSTKVRDARMYSNRIVVIVTANEGRLSQDLLNRSLPIRLEVTGDVREREPAIGNPREVYLPRNRRRIEAELHGMMARWIEAGRPLDECVRHPMTAWAQTVGGILAANGFERFLDNYGQVLNAEEDKRQALGILGVARPDDWLRPGELVPIMEQQGLVGRLIPQIDRENFESRRRRLGVVLSAHEDETLRAETETEALRLKVRKARFRRDAGQDAKIHYRFEVLDRTPLPELEVLTETEGAGQQQCHVVRQTGEHPPARAGEDGEVLPVEEHTDLASTPGVQSV